jgi:hypothetical protein
MIDIRDWMASWDPVWVKVIGIWTLIFTSSYLLGKLFQSKK